MSHCFVISTREGSDVNIFKELELAEGYCARMKRRGIEYTMEVF
ncbi:MAG: hypothetical protein ABFD07_17915 [Methanobacterium sp.]